MNKWQLNHLDLNLINLALEEDLASPFNDITTNTIFTDQNNRSTAKIISKNPEPIIVCGLPIVEAMLELVSKDCEISTKYKDGDTLSFGNTLLTLKGSAHTLLMLERTILNFLQRLSAVATKTAKFVDLIKHTHTKILDTRKTLPGFRHLDKYAVQCGGGINHRMGLYDAIMIKDTHIDSLGGMANALKKLPDDVLDKYPVIVEVRNKFELNIVLKQSLHKVTRVLLDNMTVMQLTECVELCNHKIQTEASGNINVDNILSITESGVNYISIGQLTHSPGSVDLSMICEINNK